MKKMVALWIICFLLIMTTFPAIGTFERDKSLTKLSSYQHLAPFDIQITKPEKGYLYINDMKTAQLFFFTMIIGSITIEVNISGDPIQRVEFYCNSLFRHTDYYEPFTWQWDESAAFRQTMTVKAYNYEGNSSEVTLPVWIFKGKQQNTVPYPWITDPAGNGLLFDPLWKTTMVTGNITGIRVFEANQTEDISSVLFEFSPDESTWYPIGIDTFGGFDGFFVPDGDDKKIGDDGWGILWNISDLSEGGYTLRATMTDEHGQTSSTLKKTYYDPVPPTPEISSPSYGEMIQGTVEFCVTTIAQDIASMTLSVYNGTYKSRQDGGWYNQSGLGDKMQTEGACVPVSAGNALKGQNDPDIYLPGHPGDLVELIHQLVSNMKTTAGDGTNTWQETGNKEATTDNVGSVLKDYLLWRKIGCTNPLGYEVTTYHIKIKDKNGGKNCWPVAGSNEILWKKYDEEIRKNEAVILTFSPWGFGHDGKPGTQDDILLAGHAVTGMGSNAIANSGNHSISYVDPKDGKPHVTTWSSVDGFSVIQYGNQRQLITGMWAISKKQKPLSYIGIDTNPTDGWQVAWNTTTVPNGWYTLLVDMTDAHGFVGRDVITVHVNNTSEDSIPPHSWADPSGGTVHPYTPIWINATDEGGSGVAYIHFEVWHDGVPVHTEDYSGDSKEIQFQDFGIYDGSADLIFWAVDHAGNIETPPNMCHYIVVM